MEKGITETGVMRMMNDINAQMAELPGAVQSWVNWLMIVFVLSVFFLKNHRPARVVLAAFLLTMPLAMGIFAIWQNIHLFALAHLIVWIPLLTYLYRSELSQSDFKPGTPYGVWMILLVTTMVISLLFDVGDVYLVATGVK